MHEESNEEGTETGLESVSELWDITGYTLELADEALDVWFVVYIDWGNWDKKRMV